MKFELGYLNLIVKPFNYLALKNLIHLKLCKVATAAKAGAAAGSQPGEHQVPVGVAEAVSPEEYPVSLWNLLSSLDHKFKNLLEIAIAKGKNGSK